MMRQIEQNPAFLYGESVFVTCKVHDGIIHFWTEHLERLLQSAVEYFVLPEGEKVLLREQVLKEVEALPKSSGSLRISVHGKVRDFFKPTFKVDDLEVTTLLRPYKMPVAAWKLKLFFRNQDPLLDNFKIGSYGKEFFLKRKAILAGYDDVLFHDHEKVFELTTSNIFFIKGKTLVTPQSGIYKGLMREKIIQENQVEVRDVYLHELKNFDGAFATNCLIGKHPVIIEGAW